MKKNYKKSPKGAPVSLTSRSKPWTQKEFGNHDVRHRFIPKTNKILLSGLIIAISLFSKEANKTVLAESAPQSTKLVKLSADGQIDWANKVIRVKGKGALPNEGGVSQKRLKARIAARMDAYRNLAELINGVQVTSETVVKNFVTQSDVMKLRVDAVVKGARQTGLENQLPDGSVEVELYLPLFGNGSIASALDLGNYVKNKNSIDAYFPYNQVAVLNNFALPVKIAANNFANQDNISGLIIDASTLGVQPAMSPFIIAGGKIVYAGHRVDMDPDSIVRYGITDYTDSLDNAKKDTERIGKNPVVIEASGVVGKPARTNILLDEVTVQNLLKANEKTKFLNKLGVVIVI